MTHAPVKADPDKEQRQRLQVLVSAALRSSVAALDGFTRRLGSAMTEASLRADDAAAAAGLQRAAEHLSRERASFQRLFSDCLQHDLEQEARTLLARPKSRLRSDALDLSLNSFEAMQRKVLIDNLAQSFDRSNAELLSVLHLRLAHWLGREPAGLINPFRAEVFLHAALSAWDRFDNDAAARAVLLQQLSPGVFLSLEAVLSAVDQELQGRDVLPEAELHYQRRAQTRTAPGMALLHAERRSLAHAGEVFDLAMAHLVRAGTLPAHTLCLLACLQPALHTIALEDRRFLLSPRHPGRRLLQRVTHASLASDPGTPLARALQDLVDRLAAALAREPTPQVLEAACKRVEGHLAPLLQSLTAKRDACIADATRQEREARADQTARSEVMARLENGTAPDFVEHFLLERWAGVLAYAQSAQATKPALLPNLVQAMDDLIWSVQPKVSAQEREEFKERMPALLSLLNAWLTAMKWEGEARRTFFEQLTRRHCEVLQVNAQVSARDALEARMDVAQRATEHDMRRRAREQEEEELAAYMRRIDALVTGDWVEFVRNDGTTVQCRLAWISAVRVRFVFVAPAAQIAFAIGEDVFAQGLRAGRVRIVATGEVFQAALSIALGELPVTDATSLSAQSAA